MDRLAYTALSGVLAQGYVRTQLAHELSNVSTPGFKKGGGATLEFREVIGEGFPTRYQPVNNMADGSVDLSPGAPLISTGNDMDIAMNYKTVMGVQAEDGSVAFTRRGDMRVTASGVVELGNGLVVLGDGGGPLTVPPGVRVTFGRDGGVYAANLDNREEQPQLVANLMLRDASQAGLVRRMDGLYELPTAKGAGGDFESGPSKIEIESGRLESSNVSPIEALVSLMEFNRSFETQIKVIKSVSELDSSGQDLMKLRA